MTQVVDISQGVDSLLDELCALFDEELERQENVLAVCRGQAEAARAHDIPALEARTRALDVLMDEAVAAELRRNEVVRRIVGHTALPRERQTLSGLIAIAPKPWQSHMASFQNRLPEILAETRRTVAENTRFFSHSLRIFGGVLRGISGEPEIGTYDCGGRGPGHALPHSTIVNARG